MLHGVGPGEVCWPVEVAPGDCRSSSRAPCRSPAIPADRVYVCGRPVERTARRRRGRAAPLGPHRGHGGAVRARSSRRSPARSGSAACRARRAPRAPATASSGNRRGDAFLAPPDAARGVRSRGSRSTTRGRSRRTPEDVCRPRPSGPGPPAARTAGPVRWAPSACCAWSASGCPQDGPAPSGDAARPLTVRLPRHGGQRRGVHGHAGDLARHERVARDGRWLPDLSGPRARDGGRAGLRLAAASGRRLPRRVRPAVRRRVCEASIGLGESLARALGPRRDAPRSCRMAPRHDPGWAWKVVAWAAE